MCILQKLYPEVQNAKLLNWFHSCVSKHDLVYIAAIIVEESEKVSQIDLLCLLFLKLSVVHV